jgi:hypothetical protein
MKIFQRCIGLKSNSLDWSKMKRFAPAPVEKCGPATTMYANFESNAGKTHMQNLNVKPFITLSGRLLLLLLLLNVPCVYSDDNMPEASQMQDQPEAAEAPQLQDQPEAAEAPQMQDQPEAATAPSAEVSNTVINSHNVVRALLTTAIVNREPADEVTSINKNQERIYFFTEFTGSKGQLIKHRWEYQGKVMAEVNFNIGSSQWRCYSSKNILPEWTGTWTVSVVDDKNQVLAKTHFEVTD